jgi:hypothetical protein
MNIPTAGESRAVQPSLETSWLLYWFVDDLLGTGDAVPNARNDSIEQWADLNDVEIAVRQESRELRDYILVIPVERAVEILSDFARTIGFLPGGNDFVEYGSVPRDDPRLDEIRTLIDRSGSYLSD